MPCDTYYDQMNMNEYNDVLDEISRLCVILDPSYIVCAGDFNTDLNRSSLHTRALSRFLHSEEICSLHEKSYTFESKANFARSIIDHIFVSQNFFSTVGSVSCVDSGD